jgi:hypothetical protein
LHVPSQPVDAVVGTPVHAGAVPVQLTLAGVLARSTNSTSPPSAIVTLLAGCGFEPDISAVQHGQLFSTQFSLIWSSTLEDVAASAGNTATPAPSRAARAKSESVRDLTVDPPSSSSMSDLGRPGTAAVGAAVSRRCAATVATP